MQSVFVGFFKDINNEVVTVTQRSTSYNVDGTPNPTGLYDCQWDNEQGERAVFDKLPKSFVKMEKR